MYINYYGLKEVPFSISPDPRYLYMGLRHREALAHLIYGTQQAGGFIQLTGEVGTGKTTLTRALLQQLPSNVDIALLLNPKQSPLEFVRSICDELHIDYGTDKDSLKSLVDTLNLHLLKSHANGRRVVLLIDEAQNLTPDVLEQIRLLTNLETTKQKLLQIILVGQPELRILLARKELRQLAQRITARYHLLPLSEDETSDLIKYRLGVAGCQESLFTQSAIHQVYKLSKGIPRLINILCDRALLGSYAQGLRSVDAKIVKRAAAEVHGDYAEQNPVQIPRLWPAVAAASSVAVVITWLVVSWAPFMVDLPTQAVAGLTSMPPDLNQTSGTTENSGNSGNSVEPLIDGIEAVEQNDQVNVVVPVKASVAKAKTTADNENNLEDVLQNLGFQTDVASAYSELFKLWGKDYNSAKGDTACKRASELNLSCLYNKGTWNNLRILNRPAVLELIDSYGVHHFVVLSTLEHQMATIKIAGHSFVFPITEIDRYWLGEFTLLWKQPVSVDSIRPGMRGPAARWLKQTMNVIDGKSPTANTDNFFDSDLKMRVMSFQKDRFLMQDGIVGTNTMIHLNTAINSPDTPMLSRKKSH